MDHLRELYQEVILDHSKRPRNFAPMPEATHEAEGHNPLCGDCVTIRLHVRDGVVERASFQGTGCAISTASASLLTEAVRGRTADFAKSLFRRFREALTSGGPVDEDELGDLCVLLGVREFPMRVKCATLAWHTMSAALDGRLDPVSTEAGVA